MKDDQVISENELLRYFYIEHDELGIIKRFYSEHRLSDIEYYQYSELHYAYCVIKLCVDQGRILFHIIIGHVTE